MIGIFSQNSVMVGTRTSNLYEKKQVMLSDIIHVGLNWGLSV